VLPAKLYYLEQLKDGPVSHRLIMNRMADRYSESAAKIKDQLVAEGFIVCVNKIRQGNGKWTYFHQLTGKSFVVKKQQPVVVQENTMSDKWEDGTAKSKANAFNWRNKDQGIFNKREIMILQQKYHNNHPITIYSRA
jgi:hypothetical protein